jgi:cobalt-zinc-cadmium efflux system outer membrane protein
VVSAQQGLASSLGTYLGLLSTLWSSVVGVADFLQTDDLFQLAKPLGVPQIPELESLSTWPCGHAGAGSCSDGAACGDKPGVLPPSVPAAVHKIQE